MNKKSPVIELPTITLFGMAYAGWGAALYLVPDQSLPAAIVLAALMSVNALATDIMLPAFPDIAFDLGNVEVTRVQAVITVYMFGFAVSRREARHDFVCIWDWFGVQHRQTVVLIPEIDHQVGAVRIDRP